jgi:hypothetical protein
MSHTITQAPEPLYGLLAEFEQVEELLAAARQLREAGYTRVNGYTPFPVEGLPEALEMKPTRLPWIVLGGGIIGGGSAYFMQYYASVLSYPINVGGRPLHSWPSFLPITFELTVLGAAFAAFFGMLALNGLPHPHHPLFNIPEFKLASRDRFFLSILAGDPLFDRQATGALLESLAVKVYEVPT